MSIIRYTINNDELFDALKANKINEIRSIFSIALKVIRIGGVVIIEQTTTNSPPIAESIFKTEEEIHEWISRTSEVHKIIGDSLIDK